MSNDKAGNGHLGNGHLTTEEVRIGVFICHCGGNISDVVDVQRVVNAVRGLPNVVNADTRTFLCSDSGQVRIEKVIKDHNLNRVVVAACSPTLHQETFRRVLERAGINRFMFEHVNIREQVSWVVEDPEAATEKAIRLVSAAVGRIQHLTPLSKRRIKIHPAALVIGGGVAGLIAARDLAMRGMRVNLVEKSPFLGGRMAQLHTVFPTGQFARDILKPLMQEVVDHPLITVHTCAQVVETEGIVGDFRSRIRVEPRGVTEKLTNTGNAIAACPEEVLCEFDYGLHKRKAIFLAYPGCQPQLPAIDWKSCTNCGKCAVAVGGKGINLGEQTRDIMLTSGVIVLATGYDPYEPVYGEYGYLIFPEVVTLQQLNRLLDPYGPSGGTISRNGKPIKRVAVIHCVGARQVKGVNEAQPDGSIKDYCARTCCTASLHASLELKKLIPGIDITHFYQDIRTYGQGHEEYYERASEEGIVFVRYDANHPPIVVRDPTGQSTMVVKARDTITDDLEVEAGADLVVLATGVAPHDISELVDMYKCALGYDSFLLEVHPKLRPVELAVSGVFLAGPCQGPMNITECSSAAAAAASKAAALISQGIIEMDPFIGRVDEEVCTGCKTCLIGCPYEAITFDEMKEVAIVNEALCTGCGTCAATCPSNAILQYGFTDDQIMSELKMLLAGAYEEETVPATN